MRACVDPTGQTGDRRSPARRRRWVCLPLAALAFGMAALSATPAAARAEHHHRRLHIQYYAPREMAAPPSAGFGPTSAGASTIVIDAGTGAVLAEAGADVPRYPASLTKLMTLDLAFQALRAGRMTLDTPIPISYHAAAVEPVKLGLQPGDTITVRQAILAMTTMSANDAATALGEFLGGGSEPRCAEMMTLRAHALGMAQTEFYNASGLPNPGQITTARDLSILARDIVVGYPEYQGFFEVQKFDFEGHQVYSNNAMLKTYPGATGMKTGYTFLARHNLITSADHDGRVLIGVVLHEPSWGASYEQMTAMLDDGFGGSPRAPAMNVASNAAPVVPPVQSAPVESVDMTAPRRSGPLALGGTTRVADAGGWTAQLGLYSRMSRARIEAIAVHHMRGIGIPRIARVQSHGRILWTAQLAGLTLSAAHETCEALTARGDQCHVVAPSGGDHLAAWDAPDKLGT